MQRSNYSAAELTGENDFPSHLSTAEALALIASHGLSVRVDRFGGLVTTCAVVDRAGNLSHEPKRFGATQDGLFRASPILLWLGY